MHVWAANFAGENQVRPRKVAKKRAALLLPLHHPDAFVRAGCFLVVNDSARLGVDFDVSAGDRVLRLYAILHSPHPTGIYRIFCHRSGLASIAQTENGMNIGLKQQGKGFPRPAKTALFKAQFSKLICRPLNHPISRSPRSPSPARGAPASGRPSRWRRGRAGRRIRRGARGSHRNGGRR